MVTMPRRGLPIAFITLASILAFLAIFAVWANRQLLDTDHWTNTSSKLLENKHIRDQVSAYLADQLYANVDVQGEIESALPKQVKPLAGPAAGGLKELADRGANELLQRPEVQELWQEANRAAHTTFLDIVEERNGGVLKSNGGVVKLDLATLLTKLAGRLGVGGDLANKIPPGAAQIQVLKSKDLETAQEIVRLLKGLAVVLVVLTLLFYTLAITLARGWRREAVRAIGFGLAGVGVAVLLARSLAGGIVVDQLAKTDAIRPATAATWSIATTLLNDAGQATIAYGLFIVVAAWLAGRTRVAVAVRAWLAPFLREPVIAFGGIGVICILLLIWAPTEGLRNPLPALFMILLLFAGVEVLRRQTRREHPDADLDATRAAMGEKLSDIGDDIKEGASDLVSRARGVAPAGSGSGGRGRGRGGASVERPKMGRIEALERLARLHDAGALDDAEFAREKARILT